MISGPEGGGRPRRRRRLSWILVWAIVLSAMVHAILIPFLLWLTRLMVLPTVKERVATSTIVTIEHRPVPRPVTHAAAAKSKPVPQTQVRYHELAREVPSAPPQPPISIHPHVKAQSSLRQQIAEQERSFAKEADALNASNNPQSIATISPQAPSGSYVFKMDVPGLTNSQQGEGFFTKLKEWHENGVNCYYGHYDWAYADGSQESEDIPWPFCYEPGSDPIAAGRRTFDFPLPVQGYVLPAGTYLAPIERQVYDAWLSAQ